MKQYMFILAAIAAVSVARAQGNYDGGGQPSASSNGGSQSGGPIVIVNKYNGSQDTRQDSRQDSRQGQSTTSVQEQPLTVIESSPLRDSRAEQMRKARLSVESQTENRIVEKLESARIEDEKSRQDRVLAAPFGSSDRDRDRDRHDAAPAVVPVVLAPAHENSPPHQPPQQPIVIESRPSIEIVPIQIVTPERHAEPEERAQIETAVRPEREENLEENRYYMSGNVGSIGYSGKSNIQGDVAGGFSLGMKLPDHWVAEGSFLYSSYSIQVLQPGVGFDLPPYVKMQQYNVTGALKYQFSVNRFSPYIGGLGSYAYRRYQDADAGSYLYSYSAHTNAFDVGVTIGSDLELTKRFSIGADFRYLTNLAATGASGGTFYPISPGTPVEKSDYYTVQLVGKFVF